ncbi:Tspear [Symbiodinium sp. CCMP2456]|nr:Tspear [Symbiodinium sp. CCMP2456]
MWMLRRLTTTTTFSASTSTSSSSSSSTSYSLTTLSSHTSTATSSSSTWSSSSTSYSSTRSSTTLSATSTTTTQTEGVHATQGFLFQSSSALTLQAFGAYFAVIAGLCSLRYLWKLQDVRNASDLPGQSYGLHDSVGNDGDLREPSQAEVQEGGQVEVGAEPHAYSEDTSARGLLDRWKNSPWFLAMLMLFESVNLVSSTIYVVEAYQRAVLTDLYATCSDGTVLVPIFAAECPAEKAMLNGIRNCDAALAIGDVCGADAFTDGSKNCDTRDTLQNCGMYDFYRRTSTCGDCAMLAHLLWVCAAASVFCTVGWTCRFYTKRLEVRFLTVRPRLRWQHHFVYAFLCIWLLLAAGIGFFMEGGTAVLLMAVLCPAVAWLLWLFVLAIVVHDQAAEEEVLVQQSAALELPLFNMLVAFFLEEKAIRQLSQFRLPLQQGLRIFEDLPECMVGAVDLLFFGGSWFTALGIGMSLLMITLQLSMAVSANVLQQARRIARPGHRRQIDRE